MTRPTANEHDEEPLGRETVPDRQRGSSMWRVVTCDGVLMFSRERGEWFASTRELTEVVVWHLAAGGPWPALCAPPDTEEQAVLHTLMVLYPDAEYVGVPFDELWPEVPPDAVI